MADKSFGVKELNLLNASGTPTVTSPNNLNLNANTVAISTSATVGNNLTVSGQINVGSNIKIGNAGVVTATSFVGSGANLTGISAGISTDPSNVQATWKLGGGSGSGFTFTGPGQDGSEGNPDIYLVRGQRYLFDNTTLAGNHPFEFRNEANDADYTDGVSGAQNGLQYINVQHDAPAALKYRCTIHTGSMLGNIYIVGQHLANGANNRVLTATSAYGMNGEANLTFDGSRLLLGTTDTHGSDADDIVLATSGTTGITIRSGTGGSGNIYFADGNSGNDLFRGRISYNHGDDSIFFGTANSARSLKITSDGSTQIESGVLQRRYESTNTAGYRYYSKADRFLIAHGGSGTNLTITGMNQGWASIRFGGYTEGQRVNFRADIAGYNAGNAGVRLYDSNEITNQATAYAGGASCSITVTKNNASYVVNVTQSNPQGSSMAGFYYFESGGYNSVSTLTVS